MIEFEITYDDKGAVNALNILSKNAKMDNRIFEGVKLTMNRSIDQNFKQEGRPGKWQSLSESTLMRRRHGKKKSLGTKILQDTGMLKNSIDTTMQGNEILIGPSVRYGRFHQLGIGVPQRPFLLFQEEDITRIMKIIGDTLAENPGN